MNFFKIQNWSFTLVNIFLNIYFLNFSWNVNCLFCIFDFIKNRLRGVIFAYTDKQKINYFSFEKFPKKIKKYSKSNNKKEPQGPFLKYNSFQQVHKAFLRFLQSFFSYQWQLTIRHWSRLHKHYPRLLWKPTY